MVLFDAELRNSNWKCIVFTSEKWFNLSDQDCLNYYKHELCWKTDEIQQDIDVREGPTVWDAILDKGIIALQGAVGKMDAEEYKVILE